jgi:hypothetical protein
MEQNNGNGSATTILVAVVIVLIIGLAFYFGFMRGGPSAPSDTGGANVEVNVPDVGNRGSDSGGSGLY